MAEQTKDWKTITKEELFDYSFRQNMCDFEIAEIYGVSPEQVSYMRNKLDLKKSLGSKAFKRLGAEHVITALCINCEMDENYRRKLMDIVSEFFK